MKTTTTSIHGHKMMFAGLLFTLMALMLFTGCELTDNNPTEYSDYNAEPFLSAYVEGGKAFQDGSTIFLEMTARDLDSYYDPADYAVHNAEIVIFPILDENGSAVDSSGLSVYYTEYADTAGKYFTTSTEICRHLWTYRIEAFKDGEVDLWAVTAIPDSFTVRCDNNELDALMDSIPADPWNMPDAPWPTFTRSAPMFNFFWSDAFVNVNYDDTPEGGYLLFAETLVDTADLEPLDPDWDPSEDELEAEEMWRAGWMPAPDYQNSQPFFWAFTDYVGPQRVKVIAASYSFYRYMFSSLNMGPQSVTRPEFNVNGGLGCFGATVEHEVYFKMKKVNG